MRILAYRLTLVLTLLGLTVFAQNDSTKTYRETYPKIIDIIHTKLDLSFNWDSSLVIGKASIVAQPYAYAQNHIVLNANGFKINHISLLDAQYQVPTKSLTYTYDNHLLDIELDKTYQPGQTFHLYIDYVAQPYTLKEGKDIPSKDDRGIYFIKEPKHLRQLWTQGETECNSSWFPTINGPQEKMTQEIRLTVDSTLTTLSNGLLVSSHKNLNGSRTDVWKQTIPHATYLAMIAIGTFDVYTDHWKEMEVSYYMEPIFSKNAKLIFSNTPEMIDFFSNKLGINYPWDKYSQIVVREFVSGAMENTSASVFFDRMNMTTADYADNTHEDIIAHELFHQWFGDLVTCESWANLPLNESFATYGEYLWAEHKYGKTEADIANYIDWTTYLKNSEKSKQVSLIRYDYSDREKMFDVFSYQKGGLILHYLRKILTDEVFFLGLNLYLKKNAYKTAEIHDLRIAFEEVSGMDLNWFFNQWFLSPGHPKLNVQTTYNQQNAILSVTIKQLQDPQYPVYRLPLTVDIYEADNRKRHQTILLTERSQTFTFSVNASPILVNIDEERIVPAEKVETKTLAAYIFQYAHTPSLADKVDALQGSINNYRDENSTQVLLLKALVDTVWYVRMVALKNIEQFSNNQREVFFEAIKALAINDPKPLIRAQAVKCLKKNFITHKQLKKVLKMTAKDISPSVQKALKEEVK